jgi:hypothetical protein
MSVNNTVASSRSPTDCAIEGLLAQHVAEKVSDRESHFLDVLVPPAPMEVALDLDVFRAGDEASERAAMLDAQQLQQRRFLCRCARR